MKTKLALFITKNKNIILLSSLYFILFSLFYFVEPIRIIILKETSQTAKHNYFFIFTVINLLLIFGIYFLFSRKITKISIKELLLLSVFLNLFLLLIWPVTATDIFSYIYQGRILAVFKESPYLTVYDNFKTDIFFDFLKNTWTKHTTPYGPLFVLTSSLFSLIFKNNVWANLFSLKLFFILLNIISGWLIYKISKNKLAFYLYAFNPLIIFEFAINGHNDVLFIFFILLSFLFLCKKGDKNNIKNNSLSFLFLTLSVLTKFISIIFLPVFALILFLKTKGYKDKIKIILSFAFIFLFSAFIFYYPLVNNFREILLPLQDQSQVIGIFLSPLIIFLLKLLSSFKNISIEQVLLIGKSIFVVFYLFIIFVIIKNRAKVDSHWPQIVYLVLGIILLVFLLTSLSWLMPWYFTALITISTIILAEAKGKESLAQFIIFGSTFYGIIYYLVLR